MQSPYTLDEQETTINVLPAVVSKTAEVYTCIPNMIEKIKKLASESPDDVVVVERDGYVNATVPREWIKIQPKRKSSMTDEQKRQWIENMNIRKAQKKEARQT